MSIAFNRLDGSVNEALVRGREDIYFGAEYSQSAGTPLPAGVVKHYVDGLASSPDALRGSFGSYRAVDATIAQNAQRKMRRLSLPVLAIGGEKGLSEGTITTMKLVVVGAVPGLDERQFAEIAEKVKSTCPVSVALKGNVALDLEAKLG